MGKRATDAEGKHVSVQRKPGYLYYVDKYGSVMEAKMKHSKK